MKHWNTLTELESSLIRLGEFKNLFELLTHGVDNECSREVLNSAIYTMSSMIEDINEEAMSHFHTLWEEVRQDSDSASTLTGSNPNYESPEEAEAWKNLEDAMKNWRNTSAGD